MEIINNFGLDPLLLLAQIINFLVFIFLFNRFFLKKITVFLKEREDKIRAGLDAAQKGEQLLEKAKNTQKKIIKDAHEEVKKLLGETQQRQETLALSIKEDTQKEAQRIIEEAKRSAIEESVRVQKDLEKKTVNLAISIVEKTLKTLLTEEENKKIVTSLYKKAKTIQ